MLTHLKYTPLTSTHTRHLQQLQSQQWMFRFQIINNHDSFAMIQTRIILGDTFISKVKSLRVLCAVSTLICGLCVEEGPQAVVSGC